WNADKRFREAYLDQFPGYYKTADAGYIDDDGYLFIMARTDDIINVAGHRLSTGAMEEVLAQHPQVAECAVVGIADALKGQVPVGFVVLNAGVDRPPSEIEKEAVALVREKIGPVASFRTAITVKRLPKTRSGKILRGTMQKIADKEAWTMPATIDDPAILDEIEAALNERGLGGSGAPSRGHLPSTPYPWGRGIGGLLQHPHDNSPSPSAPDRRLSGGLCDSAVSTTRGDFATAYLGLFAYGARLARAWWRRRAARRTRMIIEDLPASIRKDIGWPNEYPGNRDFDPFAGRTAGN